MLNQKLAKPSRLSSAANVRPFSSGIRIMSKKPGETYDASPSVTTTRRYGSRTGPAYPRRLRLL